MPRKKKAAPKPTSPETGTEAHPDQQTSGSGQGGSNNDVAGFPLYTEELEELHKGEAEMAAEELLLLEEQRKSFAYGNAAIDNPDVTRDMVEQEAANIEELIVPDKEFGDYLGRTIDGKPFYSVEASISHIDEYKYQLDINYQTLGAAAQSTLQLEVLYHDKQSAIESPEAYARQEIGTALAIKPGHWHMIQIYGLKKLTRYQLTAR